MSMGCGGVSGDGFVTGMIAVADCQARLLGGDGGHGLATSGLFSALLTGLLTLAVARLGYRLLFARDGIAPHELVALVVRFGIVIALSTGWQAYDRLVYRVAMDGPGEIAGIVLPSAGIDTTRLAPRLQNAYDAIVTPPDPQLAQTQGTGAGGERSPEGMAATTATIGGGELPGTGRRGAADLMVIAGAGSWIAARLALALLLAIGPLAIATTLFEASAGLCIGWLRALIGTALAGLVIPFAIALELQVLEGPIRAAARAGSMQIQGLGAIVWSFVLVIAALVLAVQRLAGGLRLPRWAGIAMPRPIVETATTARAEAVVVPPAPPVRTIPPPAPVAPSRALAIAQAAERRIPGGHGGSAAGAASPRLAAASPGRTTPIIDGARRATAGRRTVSAPRLEARS
jgi:type IV secretion system protein VirB6